DLILRRDFDPKNVIFWNRFRLRHLLELPRITEPAQQLPEDTNLAIHRRRAQTGGNALCLIAHDRRPVDRRHVRLGKISRQHFETNLVRSACRRAQLRRSHRKIEFGSPLVGSRLKVQRDSILTLDKSQSPQFQLALKFARDRLGGSFRRIQSSHPFAAIGEAGRNIEHPLTLVLTVPNMLAKCERSKPTNVRHLWPSLMAAYARYPARILAPHLRLPEPIRPRPRTSRRRHGRKLPIRPADKGRVSRCGAAVMRSPEFPGPKERSNSKARRH